MKIYIKTNNKKFIVPFPLALAKFGISIAKSPLVLKYVPEKDRKYMEIINFNEMAKCIDILKEYKGLQLIDVKAKDGTKVSIVI